MHLVARKNIFSDLPLILPIITYSDVCSVNSFGNQGTCISRCRIVDSIRGR